MVSARLLARRMVTTVWIWLPIVWIGPATATELTPHLIGGEVYSETYTVIMDLDDGRYVQFQQAVSNIGPGDRHGMCRLFVADSSGELLHQQKMLNRDEWALESDGRLRFGVCHIAEVDGRVQVRAEVEGGLLVAELDAPLVPVRPPDHTVKAGRRFFSHRILQRWSRVTGHLTLNGGDRVAIAGYGAVHQLWVTALPRQVARSWFRAYGLGDKGAFWLLTRDPPDGGLSVGAVWPVESAHPKAITGLTMEGEQHPTAWVVESGAEQWRLEVEYELLRHAPVEAVGWVGYLVRPFLGNPVTYTYRVRLTGPGVTPGATAIVEHTVDE